MTNPNNAIGTNGAYGGRTSVNAFNDNLAIYQGRGVLSGFAVSPNAGMSVAIGGDGTTRDVAIAEDNIGNKTTINNISESPVVLNIAGAPASNSRIDAVVAYVDNPAQGTATETDNPSACGLLDVQGAVSVSPIQPDENAIRTAITADGASGTTAYYVVLGYITIASSTTDITSNMITQGGKVGIKNSLVSFDAINWNSISEIIYSNDNPSATATSINLSKGISGYKSIDVYYKDDQGFSQCRRVYVGNSSNISFNLDLVKSSTGSNTMYLTSRRCNVSGTTMNFEVERYCTFSNNVITQSSGLQLLRVFRVVGHPGF